jgi:hypothetical protein
MVDTLYCNLKVIEIMYRILHPWKSFGSTAEIEFMRC